MEERIKLIAVVPQKAASTEDCLRLVGEQQQTMELGLTAAADGG
jgi:hypothetical protein